MRGNVVYLHSHDTGRWIAPYGFPAGTPRLQRLADEGTCFQRAFCAGPTCSPSRAALLTGQCPHAAGMIGLAHRGFGLRHPGRHLAALLQDAGYETALCGVQHVVAETEVGACGYRQDLRPHGSPEAAAVGFLKDPPDRPFFLDVGFFEIHRSGRGFHPDGPQGPPLAPPAPLPDTPAVRQDVGDFAAAAGRLDAKIGRVLDALERSGRAGSTLVLYTTDHGPAFPGMKCALSDAGIGVSLILRGPGIPAGRREGALVSHLDLFPTLCDLLGIAPPPWLEGVSLAPLLAGAADRVREALFAEVTYHAAYEPLRAVRTERYKYIRRYDGRTAPVLPNIDDSPSKDAWRAAGGAARTLAAEALYDLVADPEETRDVAADPAHADARAGLRARLDDWMRRTADPLLDRLPVPAPPGAVANDPDGLSPNEPPVPVETLRARG